MLRENVPLCLICFNFSSFLKKKLHIADVFKSAFEDRLVLFLSTSYSAAVEGRADLALAAVRSHKGQRSCLTSVPTSRSCQGLLASGERGSFRQL